MTDYLDVAIIDYQLSNLFSVWHACNFVGLNAKITSDKNEIVNAKTAILPGVGAFGDAMKNLKKLDLIKPINQFINSGKPFMGICLGFQLLFSQSNEFGIHQGLNYIKGTVKKIPDNFQHRTIKVPQIGWNQIYKPKGVYKWKSPYLEDVKNYEFMYFVHSYYVKPQNDKVILSLTNYDGLEYCSSVSNNNIFAVQFHPEKSGAEGVKIYYNWARNIH